MRRVIAVSTGFTLRTPLQCILRIGLGYGDVLIIINSEPFTGEASRVVEQIEDNVRRIYGDIRIIKLVLDPRDGFEENVRLVRRTIESYRPCRAYLLAVGGFRWLSILLATVAQALATRSLVNGVRVESLVMLLEESPMVLKTFRTLEERLIEVRAIPRIADVTPDELMILEAIAEKHQRTRSIARYLRNKGLDYSEKTVSKKLQELVRKGLVTWEKRGKTYLYKLTPIGKTIA